MSIGMFKNVSVTFSPKNRVVFVAHEEHGKVADVTVAVAYAQRHAQHGAVYRTLERN